MGLFFRYILKNLGLWPLLPPPDFVMKKPEKREEKKRVVHTKSYFLELSELGEKLNGNVYEQAVYCSVEGNWTWTFEANKNK